MKPNPRLLLPLAGSIALLLRAGAAEIEKANNGSALNTAASWVGGVVPTASDVALFDRVVTVPNSAPLGGDLSWLGIRVTDVAGARNTGANVTIANPASANTLTLGAAGIDMSTATQTLLMQPRLLLAADQTWDIGNANTATGPAALNVSEDLALVAVAAGATINLGGFTATKTGVGVAAISSGHVISNGTFAVNGGTLHIQGGASRTTTVAADAAFLVNSGGNLAFASQSGGITVGAPVTLNTGGTLTLIPAQATPVTLDGTVNVAGNSTINVSPQLNNAQNAGAVISLNGQLTGSGNLTYNNTLSTVTNFLRLNGNNSGFSGTLTMAATAGARLLRLQNAASGSAAATWVISAGNTLEVDGISVELGTLSGAGMITNSHGTNFATINVGAGDFSGSLFDGAVPLILSKVGSGTLTLSGTNFHTGETSVTGGTLIAVPGSVANSAVSVREGATFASKLLAAGTTVTVPSVTVSSPAGGTIRFDLGTLGIPTAAPLTTNTFTALAATTLRVTGMLAPGSFPLIDYTDPLAGLGFNGFSLALPPRVVGSLVDNQANTSVDVQITGVDLPKWTGATNGNWDSDDGNGTGTPNWREVAGGAITRYLQSVAGADTVRFDDSATGTTRVNLLETLFPNGITVENNVLTYTFEGPGRITGNTALTKDGTGLLRIANTGVNDYTGSNTINAGTLELGDGVTTGAGNLGSGEIINHGTLSLNRPDAFTINSAISGNGGLTKFGASTVTFSSPVNLAGAVVIDAGTLTFGAGGNLSGVISGTGALAVTSGTFELSGSEPNTFGGTTAVSGGVLRLNKAFGVNALGAGFTTSGNGSVVFAQPEQIPDSATIIHTSSVNLDFGAETFANATVNSSSGAQIIARDGFTATGTVTINAGVFSTASNTFLSNVGGVAMTGGTLRIAANAGPSTLTVGAGGIVASGGVIEVGQGTGAFDAVMHLGGDFTATANLQVNRGGFTGVEKREIDLGNADRTFTIAAGTTTNVRPEIVGTGGLIKSGSGVLELLGNVSYTGATRVNEGTVGTATTQTGTSSVTVADAAVLAIRIPFAGTTLATPSLNLGTSSGASLRFDLSGLGNPIAPPLQTDALTANGTNNLAIVGATSTGTFPLIDYAGAIGGSGFGSFVLQLPLRVAGSLVHNTAETRIDVNILGTDTPKWNGDVNGNWDIDDGTGTGTANWRGAFSGTALRYLQTPTVTDAVIFDDSLTGTATVNLTTALAPTAVSVDNSARNYTFTGSVKLTGPMPLTKSGSGTLVLSNTGLNDYSGTTTLNAGTLQIGDGVTPGAGSLGSGAIANEGVLVLNRPDDFTLSNAITGGGSLVQSGSGVTTLVAAPGYTGTTTLNAGTLRLLAGGNIISVVAGPGALESAGGTLELSGFEPNTNSGVTTVSGGRLRLAKGDAIDAVGGDVTITGPGILTMIGSEQVPDTATIRFTGTSADSTGGSTGTETVANVLVAPSIDTGQFIMRNNFVITGTATVQNGILGIASGHTAEVNAIVMTGGIVRIAGSAGPSMLTVGAGGITASAGVIEVKFNTNNQDAVVNLGGNFTATGNVAINNANYNGGNLNQINLTDTRTFDISAGTTTTVHADLAGEGGLIKTGAGTLSLELLSSATHAGETTVTGGTLLVKGSISGTARLDIGGSGSLSGSGTIAPFSGGSVNLLEGGKLAPGANTGALFVDVSGGGTLSLAAGVAASNSQALLFDLENPVTSDVVRLTGGSLTIGTGALGFDDFAFTTLSTFDPASSYTLFDADLPVVGTLATNSTGTLGGQLFELRLEDNGNDLVLAPIPEPGAATLLAGALGALIGLRRRRCR